MKTLIALLAVVLSLGAYYSEDKAATTFDPDRPLCRNQACKRHSPYRQPKTPGRDWPIHPTGDDPSCDLWAGFHATRPRVDPPEVGRVVARPLPAQ